MTTNNYSRKEIVRIRCPNILCQYEWNYKGILIPILAGDGQFNFPHSIAVNSDGRVYVTDLFNSRVQVFAPSRVPPTG
jgi:hypothetical protein